MIFFSSSRYGDIETIFLVEIERPRLKEKGGEKEKEENNRSTFERASSIYGNVGQFFSRILLCNSFIVSSLLMTRKSDIFFFLSRNSRTLRVDFYLKNVRIIKS